MIRRAAAIAGLFAATAMDARAEPVSTAGATVLPAAAIEDGPSRGPKNALVTVEFFCNFSHVNCTELHRLLNGLRERVGDDLRVVYRQEVAFRDSEAIAEATLEAWSQGRFFAFAELAATSPTGIRRRDLDGLAARAGLDLGELRRALAERRHKSMLERDGLWRDRIGALGANLVWNGVAERTEPNAAAIEQSYRRAAARARAALEEGLDRSSLYATLLREAARERSRPTRGRAANAALTRVRVPTGAAPARGPDSAAVTIVLFSDFTCALCRTQAELMARAAALYPGQIRLVYKHFPAGSASSPGGNGRRPARPAAEAAACAHRQGRFWAVHDAFFAQPLSAPDLPRRLVEAGIDLERYQADLDAGSCAALVDADIAEGRALGVDSPVTLFVNGIKLTGDRGLAALRAVVEAELAPGLLEDWTRHEP